MGELRGQSATRGERVEIVLSIVGAVVAAVVAAVTSFGLGAGVALLCVLHAVNVWDDLRG